MTYYLDKILKDGKIEQVLLHESYDNGSFIEDHEISIEDLHNVLVKMMRRDGLCLNQ